MFVVAYTPTTSLPFSDWKIDSELIIGKDGESEKVISSYEELEEALDRVKKIRGTGGEACLMVIIE